MLKVIEYGKDEYEFPALVVLGCFDAIHAGHRELLKKAKLQAKINGLDLGVMMFKEGKSGKLVYSFEERCAFLEQYNVKFVLAVDFNDEFKAIAPLDFLNEVEDKINVKAYMSGKDFRFGAQAKGKSSTLKNYAEDEENGVWYMPIKDVDLNGDKISTTLIKSCLDSGDVAKANLLLGSEFSVTGEVVKGEGRGTSVVGFPTVNIVYPEWKHPLKYGVYSVKCLIGETDYNGIANFGNCPTFGDDRIALEVYLENFSGDLYGQILTIRFIDFIREIEEFGSAEELSGQLKNDLLGATDELAATDSEEVAEEPVETVVEEVAEEPVETVVEEVAEKPAETVVEEVAEEPVEAVVEEVTEEPVETVVEEVTEELAETVVEEVAEEPAEIVVEEVAEEPAETVVEEVAEEPAETVVEEVAEEPVETVVEEVTEEPVETVVEEVIEEQPTEQPAETVTEAETDNMQYTEGENVSEADAEENCAKEKEISDKDDGEQLDVEEIVAETEEPSDEDTKAPETNNEEDSNGESD